MSTLEMRQAVARAHRALRDAGLTILSFGNGSVIDRKAGVVAIKPSGLDPARLRASDVVIVDLATGRVVDGPGRPSSDTPTHLALYRAFPDVAAIVHTHSPAATAWAQAGREIPCLGTTHADHFRGDVPVTRPMSRDEIETGYEAATGRVIVERFGGALDPGDMPGVLVRWHGPFVWGSDMAEAVAGAVALEHIATIALHQAQLGSLEPLPAPLLARHFDRKHGPAAYYGQPSGSKR